MKKLSLILFIFMGTVKLNAQQTQGIASFYSDDLSGSFTAYGDVYDKTARTAAHATYPVNTKLKITSLVNGRSTVVRVNDKLAANSKKTIMLSRAAADDIFLSASGVMNVSVELAADEQPALAQNFVTESATFSSSTAIASEKLTLSQPKPFEKNGVYDCDGKTTSLKGFVIQVAALSSMNSFKDFCSRIKAIEPEAKIAVHVSETEKGKLYRILVEGDNSAERTKARIGKYGAAGYNTVVRSSVSFQ